MSKVGKKPVDVPSGVTPRVEGQKVSVKGPKGELSFLVPDDVAVKLEGNQISVNPRTQTRKARTMWGTSRASISNIVTGVSKGFEKKLEINGVGYKAAAAGKNLNLSLGYSHEVI
jgi:large subunit ribosomal protein L6